MKASDLIRMLQECIAEYGDLPIFSGGTDYPEPVTGIHFNRNGNGYVSAYSFSI